MCFVTSIHPYPPAPPTPPTHRSERSSSFIEDGTTVLVIIVFLLAVLTPPRLVCESVLVGGNPVCHCRGRGLMMYADCQLSRDYIYISTLRIHMDMMSVRGGNSVKMMLTLMIIKCSYTNNTATTLIRWWVYGVRGGSALFCSVFTLRSEALARNVPASIPYFMSSVVVVVGSSGRRCVGRHRREHNLAINKCTEPALCPRWKAASGMVRRMGTYAANVEWNFRERRSWAL